MYRYTKLAFALILQAVTVEAAIAQNYVQAPGTGGPPWVTVNIHNGNITVCSVSASVTGACNHIGIISVTGVTKPTDIQILPGQIPLPQLGSSEFVAMITNLINGQALMCSVSSCLPASQLH
jgi:hypothetical protein